MNDHRLPPDEAASAFLDGELGAEEAEAVRRHPRLAARARALRRAAEAVGEDVAPPPGAADAAVEAALADFDARRSSAAELAQRRPRGLTVIAGVAAAVAIGFIVAAAVGLFAERESDIADTAAVHVEAPAAEAAPTAAAEPPPPPAEPAAEALAVPTTSAPQAVLAPPPPAAAPLPAPEPAPAVDEPGAALAAAQADADAAMAEAEAASAAQAEAAAQPAPAPAAEPPPPAADEAEALDDAGPEGIVLADPPPEEACTAAIGDRTVELRLTVGSTPILVLGTSDGSPAALDGTTCADIPPPDGTETVADEAPDGCAGAIGDGTVDLRLTFSGTRILVVRATDGSLSALDGTTCGAIPTG